MRSSSSIKLATDLGAYFKDQVVQTAKKQGLVLTPHVSDYLSKLLERFSRTQSYFLQNTMAETWLESFSKNPTEQFFQLQSLGDFALFTSGFFNEYVRKSMLDQDYYFAIGGQAYERAGHIRESISAERAMNTYFELAEGFKEFAEIFAELSDQSLLSNDKDTLKLYEKWLEQKSARIARMLAENGIIAADDHRGRGSFD
jgi:hypothetical protein